MDTFSKPVAGKHFSEHVPGRHFMDKFIEPVAGKHFSESVAWTHLVNL